MSPILDPGEIDAIATSAVWEILERGTPAAAVAVAADATFLAACHLEDVDRERLDAGGVAAAIYPAGYWKRLAAPYVAAVLAENPPIPDDALPALTADGLRAALAANGGVLEGDLADVARTIQRHTARLAGEC